MVRMIVTSPFNGSYIEFKREEDEWAPFIYRYAVKLDTLKIGDLVEIEFDTSISLIA